ncbi:hypothetical protein DR095_01300 [Mycoplasma flocculare]|uniref:hypothetical protein n=1 Tax=Mesomycoplasma flocculare TaxID=2128 RepID=UPI00136CB13E|nr:hypothetical protein [Mesomycoplasma flocculare]MXR56027.1 hypothetical protein [Mesomycoplasma flocculare]
MKKIKKIWYLLSSQALLLSVAGVTISCWNRTENNQAPATVPGTTTSNSNTEQKENTNSQSTTPNTQGSSPTQNSAENYRISRAIEIYASSLKKQIRKKTKGADSIIEKDAKVKALILSTSKEPKTKDEIQILWAEDKNKIPKELQKDPVQQYSEERLKELDRWNRDVQDGYTVPDNLTHWLTIQLKQVYLLVLE